MLEAIRRATTSWVVKILLFPLIVSFALWGVADVFRGFGQGAIAKIGDTEITVEQFQQAYQSELDRMAQLFGRRPTPEQARQFDLEGTVLGRLVDTAALDAHATELGLALSEQSIAAGIRETEAFRGPDGKFSRPHFDEILRRNGLSEARYMDERRRGELREHLTRPMLAAAATAEPMIALVHAFREESRRIEHFTLDPEKVVKLPAPTEAQLKEHYEQAKSQFMTPERRNASILLLEAAAVRKRVPIEDKAIADAYEADKNRWIEAEKRHVWQLSFPDKAAAETARGKIAEALAAGKPIAEAITAAGAKVSDVDLGTITRRDLIDPAIAEAAFGLEKGKLSAPVAGRFTTVVLYVSEVTPSKQRALEDVKKELRDELAQGKVAAELEELHKRVDDERAASRPFKEIAEKVGIELRSVEGVERSGNRADGKPAIEHPEARRIVSNMFEGRVGLEAEPIELADGGFIWVDVAGITPSSQKSFEDAKAEVEASWRDAERRKALTTYAEKLVERLQKGESMAAVAASASAEVRTSEGVKRTATPQGLARRAVDLAFSAAKGGVMASESADGKSRTILRVAEVTPAAPPTKEQREALERDLSGQLQNDRLTGYVAALKARLGVSVNQTALRRTMGLEQQP
jgi:peptidyl-prolyl cis-trans isomerase D